MFGTLSLFDSLAANFQSLAQIGEDFAFEAIQQALDYHNALVREELGTLVEATTDRLRRYGTPDSATFEELDEFGTPSAQKVSAGATVGFPLRMYGSAVQWTRKFMEVTTGAELAASFLALQDADARMVQRQIKRALFTPSNYSFEDRLVDRVVVSVKALVNADGLALPLGANGQVFDPTTHTHYLACATPGTIADADLAAFAETVIEHWGLGQLYFYINRAQEASIRALSAGGHFHPYTDVRLIQPITQVNTTIPLDQMQLYNRAIGLYDAAEVWVKPWIPAGYIFCFIAGAPKPLVMRERMNGSGDMQIVAEFEEHPLHARAVEREVGFAVWQRTNGAILDTQNAVYTTPVLTA